MDTFFMFGKYSSGGLREIDAARTAQVRSWVAESGGSVRGAFALLGEYDLVIIVELPNITEAMKTAVSLGKLTGISFSTCAAMPVEHFDKIADDLSTEIASARMEAGE